MVLNLLLPQILLTNFLIYFDRLLIQGWRIVVSKFQRKRTTLSAFGANLILNYSY